MINCLLFFFVFSSGFLAAYIDWVQFLREAFSLAGMQHQSRFLLCLTVILLSWAIPCYVGFKVYETAQSKFAHFYPIRQIRVRRDERSARGVLSQSEPAEGKLAPRLQEGQRFRRHLTINLKLHSAKKALFCLLYNFCELFSKQTLKRAFVVVVAVLRMQDVVDQVCFVF